ncbi:hypothetical protein LIHA111178_11495 [Litorimonas haliclonae]
MDSRLVSCRRPNSVSGVCFSSLRVIALLENIGGSVSFGKTLSMVLYDLFYFAKILYLGFVGLGLLIAFGVGSILLLILELRSRASYRFIVFSVAGAVSMGVMLWAMKNVFFGMQLVAGARDGTGIFLQILAGILGGLVFALLTRPKPPKLN